MSSKLTSFNWFPGHMKVALDKVKKEQLKKSDIMIHILDSRLPLTSRNHCLFAPNKKTIMVYNKSDLVEKDSLYSVLKRFRAEGKINPSEISLICNKNNRKGVYKIIDIIRSNVKSEFSTTFAIATIVGFPNVGKSSIINRLKSWKIQTARAKVGAVPCITRNISSFIVSRDPNIAVFDTPGIFSPGKQSKITAFKLSVVGCISSKSNMFDLDIQALVLLEIFNRLQKVDYMEYLSISSEIHNLDELIECVAERNSGNRREDFCLNWFLKKYRAGMFGKFILDDPRVDMILDEVLD